MINANDLKKLGFVKIQYDGTYSVWMHNDIYVGYGDFTGAGWFCAINGDVDHWTDLVQCMVCSLETSIWESEMGDDL